MNNREKENAITLIALVITIIVLLILAGVTIATLTGENGLLARASRAGEETKKAEALENLKMKIIEVQAEKSGNATLSDFVEYLTNDTSAEYTISLTQTSTISGTLPEGINSAEKIYVTYNGYEFEITNSLQITLVGGTASLNNGSHNSSGSAQSGENSASGLEVGNVSSSGQSNSKYISSVAVSTLVDSDNIKITVIPTATDTTKILGYHYFVVKKDNANNVQGKMIEDTTFTIKNLTRATNYNVFVIAYDIYNNYRISETTEVITLSESLKLESISLNDADALDYAIVTSKGIANCKSKSTGEYCYCEDISNHWTNFKNAFDNNSTTIATGSDYNHFDVDESAWGKRLYFSGLTNCWVDFELNNKSSGNSNDYCPAYIDIPEGATVIEFLTNSGATFTVNEMHVE